MDGSDRREPREHGCPVSRKKEDLKGLHLITGLRAHLIPSTLGVGMAVGFAGSVADAQIAVARFRMERTAVFSQGRNTRFINETPTAPSSGYQFNDVVGTESSVVVEEVRRYTIGKCSKRPHLSPTRRCDYPGFADQRVDTSMLNDRSQKAFLLNLLVCGLSLLAADYHANIHRPRKVDFIFLLPIHPHVVPKKHCVKQEIFGLDTDASGLIGSDHFGVMNTYQFTGLPC